MASLVTTRILILRDIKVLHIEPTDVCQAACPLCARETDPKFCKDQNHHLTIRHIQQHFNDNRIKSLDKVFMCGNYGDPAANDASTTIFSYVKSINSNIVLGMNTNGGLQNRHWWTNLANILNLISKLKISFSLGSSKLGNQLLVYFPCPCVQI